MILVILQFDKNYYEVSVTITFKERKAMIADLKKKQKAEMIENTAEDFIKSSAKNKLKKAAKSDESDYIVDER